MGIEKEMMLKCSQCGSKFVNLALEKLPKRLRKKHLLCPECHRPWERHKYAESPTVHQTLKNVVFLEGINLMQGNRLMSIYDEK